MIITAVFIHKLLLVENRYLPILFFLMRFCQLILHYQLPKNNKGQSNLAIGDIARFIMTSDTAHSVSTSSIIFARWQHASRSWSWCVHLELPFWDGGCRGKRWYHSKEVVSYRLSVVTITLSLTFPLKCAIECLRRSNQQGWVTLGQNWERQGLADVRQILNCEKHGDFVCKSLRNRVDIFYHLNTMQERDRQTDRQTR